MKHIPPTVGRIVYFNPQNREMPDDFSWPATGKPLAAIIASVSEGEILTLAVFDQDGRTHPVRGVLLAQGETPAPYSDCYAYWMPYQIDQAKKDESNIKAARSQTIGDQINKSFRAEALNQALRTPGVDGHADVLIAARAYVDYIIGTDHAEMGI